MSRRRELTGRVLAVTGASAGIGRAVALAAAAAGMDLVLNGRRREKLEDTARSIEARGRRALAVPGDVADRAAMAELVARGLERFGRLDALLANAGFGFHRPLARVGREEHERIFAVNYWGTVHAWQAALPVMRERGEGHLLLTTSVLARAGAPFFGPYCATKAAQDALAAAVRAEVKGAGIDVTSIFPVVTETEFHRVSARHSGRDESGIPPVPRPFRQSAEQVARKVVRCLRKPVPEVWPAPAARWLVALTTLWPGLGVHLMDRWAKKVGPG